MCVYVSKDQLLKQLQFSLKSTINTLLYYKPFIAISTVEYHYTLTMKTFTITTILAIIVTCAIADNCKQGLFYCSSTLLKKGKFSGEDLYKIASTEDWLLNVTGKYGSQINDGLKAVDQTDLQAERKALWLCEGGENGNIKFDELCAKGCQDAGPDKDDYCSAWGHRLGLFIFGGDGRGFFVLGSGMAFWSYR